MATQYGTFTSFETARTLIVTELNALKANMVTNSIVPAISSVHSTHHADPALTFNAVSVGQPSAEDEFPALKSDPGGPYITSLVTVEVRVMIGNRNDYMDEIKIGRLLNSIMNWLQENRAMDASNRVWDTMRTTIGDAFDDTDTIGGTLQFLVRSCHSYMAA